MSVKQEETQEETASSESGDAWEGESIEETPEEEVLTWKQKLWSWAWQIGLVLALYLGITSFMGSSLLATGEKAPDFKLSSLDGKEYKLSTFRGKRVIIHFWATWCGVCKANLYSMRYVQSFYKTDPVFLSVVSDPHQIWKIRSLQEKHKLNYPILFAKNHTLESYKISRYPTTYFIDKHGRIASKDSGYLTPPGLWWRSFWVWLTT